MAKYKGRFVGNNADISCYSFHETKNITMGEGGAIIFNNKDYLERAEILREKGTNRTKFLLGQVDKYTWVDKGGSYLPSDLNAAYLYAQLEIANKIHNNRLKSWNFYHSAFECLEDIEGVDRPYIPDYCDHNGHMYYIKTRNLEERTRLISYLEGNDIQAVFHYVPLHSSPAGLKFSRFNGEDIYTTKESERLVRLPLYYGLEEKDAQKVVDTVKKFYNIV